MTMRGRLLRLEQQCPGADGHVDRDAALFTQRLDALGDRFEPADAELGEEELRGMRVAQHWAWVLRFGNGTAAPETLAAICADHGVSLPLFRSSLEENYDACS